MDVPEGLFTITTGGADGDLSIGSSSVFEEPDSLESPCVFSFIPDVVDVRCISSGEEGSECSMNVGTGVDTGDCSGLETPGA